MYRELKKQYTEEEWITKREEIFKKLPKYANVERLYKEEKWQLLDYLRYISRLRGGFNPYGSCIWCDVREWLRDNALVNSNSYQIFGHTQLREEPIITDKIACLDCRRGFFVKKDGNCENDML